MILVMRGGQSGGQRSVATKTVAIIPDRMIVVEELTLAISVIMKEATVARGLAMIVVLPTAAAESTSVVRCLAGEMGSQWSW